ncbi:MAG: isoprenylcysteine carboxylmethyltransferase family protein [Deltaproteobacteria bacterium]|nr:isoprenylcysteine carboxylmethyltransferase family protein [Deltaproteobacteria bacterium]
MTRLAECLKGARGEWYVVAQGALFLLIVFGPRAGAGWPFAAAPYDWLGSISGIALIATGGLLSFAGIFGLGRNLTPLPRPKETASLVQSGPYRIVRHPIYSGLIMVVLGWGMTAHDWLLLVYAVLTLVFFDVKSRREERWLKEKFPEYGDYQARVRKLIPLVY